MRRGCAGGANVGGVDPSDCAAILDDYAEYLALERSRSEHTRRAYLTDLKLLFAFLDERAPAPGWAH